MKLTICFSLISVKFGIINPNNHVGILFTNFITIGKCPNTCVRPKYLSVELKYAFPQSSASRKWKLSPNAYVVMMSLAKALKIWWIRKIVPSVPAPSFQRASIFSTFSLMIGSTRRMLALEKKALMLLRRRRWTSW